MSALQDKLRPHEKQIMAAAAGGDPVARRIVNLYRMHRDCPTDPGAPALCEAAFDEWIKDRGKR